MDALDTIPTAYASCSIGTNPARSLPDRLDAISRAGFHAIELSMPDLVSFANEHFDSNDIDDHSFSKLEEAAHELKKILDAKNLSVFMMQPFANFEGWEHNSAEHKDAWERVAGWTSIMKAVDCDMLQVGSSDSPASKIGTDRSRFVRDLQELADHLAPKGQRIAYENWCWSTHAPDWKDVWDICKQVDRENFGLCLDTFQSAGGEWGDPTTGSGMVEDGKRSKEQVEADWKKSCEELGKTVPKEKIYLLQISDAYKMEKPIERKEIDGLRPRGRWSHDFRPLPFEGYLPTVDFARAVLKTGFRGWFSYEIFDGGKDGKWENEYELGPFAKKAMDCQKRLLEEVVKGA
ncbi:putative xylose isomerase-like, TIM barrel domain, xylose isomerase-like superfamily [Septoria linicola]|nr:putative xylose isomerase-like, TIM barrel domain, xylose isomerase-like superfamily [Septoria linicola]